MSAPQYGDCKNALLYDILELQGYGSLLGVDKRSRQICACSDNIDEFLDKKPDQILGRPWSEVLPPDAVSAMFVSDEEDLTSARVIKARIAGRDLLLSNHLQGNVCVVEIEPDKRHIETLSFNDRCAFLKSLSRQGEADDAAGSLTEEIAKIIDFDRVMLYKFLPDWHGKVIHERLKPGVEGFLGLRFPEADVPANARRLFTVNLQRLIADVSAATARILRLDPSVDVDLSFAQLRAVHPVHIQYLRNLGVQASFSLSIVCGGKLWGLIACHHLAPKVLSMSERQVCEELTRITAMHMDDAMRASMERKRYGYREAISEIRGAINSRRKGYTAINSKIAEIKALFGADGIWHRFDGKDFFSGNVPDEVSLTQLRNWIAGLDKNRIVARDSVPKELAGAPALVRFASGILFMPLNNDDFIVLLRQEQIEHVDWAGKPQAIDNPDAVSALTPRSSFQKWSQDLKGRSEPWHELSIETAELFREEILDYLDRSEIEGMALKDPLTGLANRFGFERRLDNAILTSVDMGSVFALYMIDLDNFKPVNDTMGHAAGDELLVQVSRRLGALVRENDTVARLGGDEFAVILSSVCDAKSIDLIAGRILEQIKRPFEIQGAQVQIGASIGVSLCPLDASSQADLLHEADVALYEVKKSGRNAYKRFEKSMLAEHDMHQSKRMQLEAAFENGQFAMHYQPLLDIRTKDLYGLEAFCVWHHPQEGIVRAGEFLEHIERHHLSAAWAEWGLRALFERYQQWQRAGLHAVPVSLNLSAEQFLHLDVHGVCQDLSQEYQIDTSWLRIDLDEQALVMNARRVFEKVSQLSAMGVLINIDHFGQGLVPLRRLTELKINHLKLQGGMFDVAGSSKAQEPRMLIFKSISNVLKTPLVVTQVESEETISFAREIGVNLFQGFAVCRPLDATEATRLLEHPRDALERHAEWSRGAK